MLADFTGLIETVKKAVIKAIDANYPVAVLYGEVIQSNPLQIRVEQKMTLEKAQLILSRNVTEHTIEMTVDHFTEDETQHIYSVIDTYTGGGNSQPTTHRHAYKGRKKFVAHNGLVKRDKVILLRVQGGQQFVVLDRIG